MGDTSEAQYLAEIGEHEREMERTQRAGIKHAYAKAKAAKTGEQIACPACGKAQRKRSYQHAFCGQRCKDWYWNRADETRMQRAIAYSGGA
ncbi:hypothetical protein [Thioalkalivibrio sp. ARh3]|uniref:hypothetical protein n=1 Tax=Thioalkalivibrio sp. ARh3 TaxID=1158148 RepID=UPI00036A286A|nr:hypothetical protein [Thioalkalivibrio sp. ARh3]